MNTRGALLQQWGQYVIDAARRGALTGKPIAVTRIEAIAGPRAGALEIQAGLDSGPLLKAFGRESAALLRQFVPWKFVGEPVAYMAGRYVRVEAGWPDALAETMIRLGDIGQNPKNGGRWVAGRAECGGTIIAGLNDRTPHYLVSGQTGSGKSVALRSAVLQLSRDPDSKLVLIDGKYGESLRQVAHLCGVVGPVAVDEESTRAAMGWACQEMRRRYETGQHEGRVVVVFDEIQEYAKDTVTIDLMRKIAAQGRTANVHLLAATQHPTVGAFGDPATRRNLTGKLALRVSDWDASRVAVGGNLPRADFLIGAGDCYTVAPGAVHRVQGAYVDGQEIGQGEAGQYLFSQWPEYDSGDIGQELPQRGRRRRCPSAEEIGAAIASAINEEGRPAMLDRMGRGGIKKPGTGRARQLLALGRGVVEWLAERDIDFCLDDWELTD